MTRRVGRPPLDPTDSSTSMNVRVPSRRYDEIYARAWRERLSVQQFVRRAIEHEFQADDVDEDE
jgi:hypothetical protein